MRKTLLGLPGWLWAQFRRLPLVLQWCFGAASLGSFVGSVFVGNIGLAAMGTAIGVSGALVGAILGLLSVVGSWAAAVIVRAKK